MTHENNKIGGGAEHPGSDEQKISEMLIGLKRVEAPKDFDFHLKARIANGRPTEARPVSLFPILKYAMPLALFLFAGAGILLYSSFNEGTNQASVPSPTVEESLPLPEINSAPAQPVGEIAIANTQQTGVETPSQVRTSNANMRDRRLAGGAKTVPAGGSIDFTGRERSSSAGNSTTLTVRVAATPRNPTGINLNPTGVSEAFRKIDADAGFDGGVWKITAVRANGIAHQMGLKSGDELKAINGKPLSESSQIESEFIISTIQVRRGGETMELKLAGKPN